MLPRRIPKKPKRASRWRSQAHCNFVRSHACSVCGDTAAIEVAHVRYGTGAGLSQKPDDWNTVSLCRDCHRIQHETGEMSFWSQYLKTSGQDVWSLIEAFCRASPRRAEIEAIKRERMAA